MSNGATEWVRICVQKNRFRHNEREKVIDAVPLCGWLHDVIVELVFGWQHKPRISALNRVLVELLWCWNCYFVLWDVADFLKGCIIKWMFEWICRVDHLRVYEQMNLLIFFIDVLFCDMVLNAIFWIDCIWKKWIQWILKMNDKWEIKQLIHFSWLIDWLIGWLIGWLIKWLIDGLNKWISEWMHACMHLMDGWMNGWMDEWMNGWMDEWMDRLVALLIHWLIGWLIDWLIDWLISLYTGRSVWSN